MMIDEVKSLLDSYASWLRDKTILEEVDGNWVRITSPYLDRHNDYVQLYVGRDKGGGYFLTDDGYTINDLVTSGCKIDTPKRQELLRLTLAGFGVSEKDDELTINANSNNFSLKKHNLLQAMLSVNDLFYLAQPIVKSLFLEDVAGWFDEEDIRYTPSVQFTGKTGYAHKFDFAIPKSRQKPERIVQTINNPRRDMAENLAFKWIDTKDTRSESSRLYAILNDSVQTVSGDVVDALKNYELNPILWSERDDIREELAA